MQFGICTGVQNAVLLKAAGADFLEENAQNFLRGLVPDDQWSGAAAVENLPLPLLAANSMAPADLKIVGPSVDFARLTQYMTRILGRAEKVGMKTIVFGSAGARNVPDGFDRGKAREQILEFLAMAAPLAQKHHVTLVAEPLNRGESNIINTVAEAMSYVDELNHPNFKCLVDSYHFWLENDSLEELSAVLPSICHVHVADKAGRTAPGESGQSDYAQFFAVLKRGGYNGPISVESPAMTDIAAIAPRTVRFLHEQWSRA